MTAARLPPGGTIAVGMSGGVDSTVAALLLREAGLHVVGLTMQIWDGQDSRLGLGRSGCYGPGEPEDIAAAAAACRRLGIAHHVVPLAPEYRQEVLDTFRRDYLEGRTPNPCVLCNRAMKFGLLLDRARASGVAFDAFATGHYARLRYDGQSGRTVLRRAADERKDQSYFLSFLTQRQLTGLVFPVGALTKAEVRAIAGARGLREALERRESQDFIECGDYSVLFDAAQCRPGPIMTADGREVGRHDGIVRYTVGQRKGLRLGGLSEPLFVTAIDAARNALIVGPREDLFRRALVAGRMNWIAWESPPARFRAAARIRQQHRESPAECTVMGEGRLSVVFDQPQMAITPGQTLVLYAGDDVVGAGVIESAASPGA